MPKTNDVKFLETFIGPCQHLHVRTFWPANGGRPFYKCMLTIAMRSGVTFRCTLAQPLTDAEIRAQLLK
jgi:hypothetical protein